MKEWLNSLSLRDKRIAILGLLVVIVAILYNIVWCPLVDKNQQLRERVQKSNELLVWMTVANKKIEALQRNAPIHSVSHSSLGIVQDELKKSHLIEYVTALKQSENDAVQWHFQDILFDDLMAWLIKIGQEQELVVSQIDVTPADVAGRVSGEMTLKKWG